MGTFNYRLYHDTMPWGTGQSNAVPLERLRIIEVYFDDTDQIAGFAELPADMLVQYGDIDTVKATTEPLELKEAIDDTREKLYLLRKALDRPILTKTDFMHLSEQP